MGLGMGEILMAAPNDGHDDHRDSDYQKGRDIASHRSQGATSEQQAIDSDSNQDIERDEAHEIRTLSPPPPPPRQFYFIRS